MNNTYQNTTLPHPDTIVATQILQDYQAEKELYWCHVDTEYGTGIKLVYSNDKSYEVMPTHIDGHISINYDNGKQVTEIYNGLKKSRMQ
ncbi:hypothetical protein [Shewanella marina]|uniref:hypothetical protein n=1 Tax=Shewanella marina TaxID=487319 RepID=UPI000471E488|nr:hypothetical protein [Shewanella marina]